MLSLFPWLLTYEHFAPFLLRLTLGAVFLYWAWKRYRKAGNLNSKTISFVTFEAVLGILFVIGFLTQLAALIAVLVFLSHIIQKIKNKAFLTDGVNYYLILLIISLCILFVGPGAIAVDLPI